MPIIDYVEWRSVFLRENRSAFRYDSGLLKAAIQTQKAERSVNFINRLYCLKPRNRQQTTG